MVTPASNAQHSNTQEATTGGVLQTEGQPVYKVRPSLKQTNLSMMVHACHPSTWAAEARSYWTLEASLSQRETCPLKRRKKKGGGT